MGPIEVQIFVSLFVILGAAFVALLCDFLKGNNERLRERNIELQVRHEEWDKRERLLEQAQRQAWNAAVQAQEALLAQTESVRELAAATPEETVAWAEPSREAAGPAVKAANVHDIVPLTQPVEDPETRAELPEPRASAPPDSPSTPPPPSPGTVRASLELPLCGPVYPLPLRPAATIAMEEVLVFDPQAGALPGLRLERGVPELPAWATPLPVAFPVLMPPSAGACGEIAPYWQSWQDATTPLTSPCLARVPEVTATPFVDFGRALQITVTAAAPATAAVRQVSLSPLFPSAKSGGQAPAYGSTLAAPSLVISGLLPTGVSAPAKASRAIPATAAQVLAGPAQVPPTLTLRSFDLQPEMPEVFRAANAACATGAPSAAGWLPVTPPGILQPPAPYWRPQPAWTWPSPRAPRFTGAVREAQPGIPALQPLHLHAVGRGAAPPPVPVMEPPVSEPAIPRPSAEAGGAALVLTGKRELEAQLPAAGSAKTSFQPFMGLNPVLHDADGEVVIPPSPLELEEPKAESPVVRIRVIRDEELLPLTHAPAAMVRVSHLFPQRQFDLSGLQGGLRAAQADADPSLEQAGDEAFILEGGFTEQAVPVKGMSLKPSIAGVAPQFGPRAEAGEPHLPVMARQLEGKPNVFRMPATGADKGAFVPAGLCPRGALEPLLASPAPFFGVAMVVAVSDFDQVAQKYENPRLAELLAEFLDSLRLGAGADAFLCSPAAGEFVLLWPKDRIPNPEHPIRMVTERVWDFQLRTLGQIPMVFGWGVAEGAGDSLGAVLRQARENLAESRRNRRTLFMGAGRFRRLAVG